MSSSFDVRKVLDFTPLKPDVVRHLRNVYALLFAGIIASAFGAIFDLFIYPLGGWLTLLLSGIVFSYAATSNRSAHIQPDKVGAFGLFAFLKGSSFAQLFRFATFVNPSILPTALFATLAVFGCFSLAAMFISRRDLLLVTSATSSLVIFSLMASLSSLLFSSWSVLHGLHLYMGVLAFVGYVLIDTQLVISRFQGGDKDVVAAAAQLYYDFFAIFIRVILILVENNRRIESRKKRS